MKFKVAPEKEASLQISPDIPADYPVKRILHAETEFVKGDFGCFSTQIISTPTWAIGWLNFSITKKVMLYPTTEMAMVALYCTIQGEIPCMLQGFGPLVLKNKKYSFYYIPPLIHNEATFVPGEYEAVYISFSNDFLEECAEEDLRIKDLYDRMREQVEKGDVLPVYSITNKELDIFAAIKSHTPENATFKLDLKSKIIALLVSYLEAGKEINTVQEGKNAKIHDVARHIRHHLGDLLGNPELAEIAGMNINTLEREFDKVFFKSPQKYVESCRMEEAEKKLIQTKLSIADIAASLGYNDPNYFSTVFKKTYKMSPTKYRKLHS
jgi:AraC-like DNA-binding protein